MAENSRILPVAASVPDRIAPVAPSELYRQHREAIDKAVAAVCRRHRLSRVEAEDFGSVLRIHVLDHDAAVLRAFGQRASMETYLHAVATHRFQDWRNAQWGKWRPSAEARRLGSLAVLLETRLVRDQLSMDEAIETLRTNHGVTEPRQTLEEMAARFPLRHGRTFVSDDVLASRPAPNSETGAALAAAAAAAAARLAAGALEEAIRALSPQDRMILCMRFNDGERIATIARSLSLDPKVLYRRLERLLTSLRAVLEARGVDADAAQSIFAHRGFELAESEIALELSARVRPSRQRGPVSAAGGRW